LLENARELIDIVICDWNMPDSAGIDVLCRVRAAGFDVPFLMVTGRADSESILEAKEAGVSAFVSKAFSQAQLEARMRIVLAKQQRVAG
jgi:two-component system chemotaxis response regulator CheY